MHHVEASVTPGTRNASPSINEPLLVSRRQVPVLIDRGCFVRDSADTYSTSTRGPIDEQISTPGDGLKRYSLQKAFEMPMEIVWSIPSRRGRPDLSKLGCKGAGTAGILYEPRGSAFATSHCCSHVHILYSTVLLK